MRTLAVTGIFCSTFAMTAAAGMPPQPGVTLDPHRAVYDLTLAWASGQSGIEGLHGRFVYSFTGAPCEGYVTEMRMVTDIAREHGAMVTDQTSSSFEDLEKGAFSFSSKMFSDYSLQSETAGEANRAADHMIAVKLGDQNPFDIGKAQFPTEYLANVLDAAAAGKHVYEAASFDGSGEEVMRAVTLIGVDSVFAPPKRREAAWRLLQNNLTPEHIDLVTAGEIDLQGLPQAAEVILAGKVRGRLIVKVA